MPSPAIERLAATVRDPAAKDADLNAAGQIFFRAVGRASREEVKAALTDLAGWLRELDPPRAAFVGLLCGTLVEQGCDPAPLAGPLTERLGTLLEAAVKLADATRERMPKTSAKEEDAERDFAEIRRLMASALPQEHAAWDALLQFWRPAIAVYSVSSPARVAARPLRDSAAKIADHHEAGHWLRLMLSVLDDEPILVIEPKTMLGILGRMSGVVDNFQLNVLIMDVFPKSGWFARRRVPKEVAEVARGQGPQQTGDTVTGVWNLYTWKAITPDLRLPDASEFGGGGTWIWNEGIPEDIPVFEGRRVVLLGPTSYARSWGSQRMFDKLPAKLDIEKQLTKDEVKEWLGRMAAAKGAG
jgi:hypothetical protein